MGGRRDDFPHACTACTNAASYRYTHQPLVKPGSQQMEAQHEAVDQRLDTPDLLHMSRVSSTNFSNLTGHVVLCKCLGFPPNIYTAQEQTTSRVGLEVKVEGFGVFYACSDYIYTTSFTIIK